MTGRSGQLDAVGCDVGASSSWERRAGPNSCRGGTQKRVSLGLHPVSLRKSKEMGWNGQQGAAAFAQGNGAHAQSANKVPPCLCLLRVRRYVGRGSMACPAIRPHFFGACPKKRCRAAKEKRLFYLGGSTIRVSATASVVFTHLRPTWGGGWWLSERLPSPGANGIGYGRFARVVLLEGVTVVIRFRLAPKSAFLWGSTPFLCARAKKWGGMGSRGRQLLPKGTAHTHRRTRTRRKKAGGKDRRLPRRCRGDPIITCTSPAGGSPLLCFHASNFQHPARGGSREACNSRRNVASLISNVGLKGP